MPDHRFHHLKIEFLTGLARPVLPGGYWAKNARRAYNHAETEHTINLTYDDGPNPSTTPGLIQLLDEEGIKATFFFIGENIARYPELVKLAHDNGHTVANHSYSHPFMPGLSRGRMAAEIDKTNDLIEAITGSRAHLFRPPYGILDLRGAKLLESRRMSPVYWGAVTEDWRNIGADAVVEHIMRRLPAAGLIVMHEGHDIAEQCLTATRRIIGRVKDMGCHFAAIK